MKKLILIISCTLNLTIQSQELNYLNCTPPKDEAIKFAPGIVSVPKQWDEKITFSPDGTEVFWGAHPIKNNYFRPFIIHATYNNGQWSQPDTLSFSKNRLLGWPMLSPDGKILFMEEVIKTNKNGATANIVCSHKENGKWTEPVALTAKIKSKEGFGLAQITLDGTFYFYDRYMHRAYSAKLKGTKIIKPKPLPYMINPAVEFYVSRENNYIIFRPINWDTPYHISFKNKDSEWTMPLQIQNNVKEKEWVTMECGPNISPDGKYLFFGRKADIYWVKADFIEDLRKKALQH